MGRLESAQVEGEDLLSSLPGLLPPVQEGQGGKAAVGSAVEPGDHGAGGGCGHNGAEAELVGGRLLFRSGLEDGGPNCPLRCCGRLEAPPMEGASYHWRG